MSQFRRRLLVMMQKVQEIWHDVVMTGTGIVIANDTTEGQSVKVFPQGWTEQVQTSGKNLLNSNIYVQGYLASIDTGQKISLNTEVKSFTTTMDINALQGKSISISIRTKGKSGKKYAFTDEEDVIINGKFDADMADYSEYNNIQVPQNAKKFYFSVTYEVQENTKLQLEYGNKATSYEPYTGGKPSPSHDYPQQIKNVGKWNEEKQKYEVDVRVTGKNLFDKDSVQLNVEFGNANSDFISMKDGWFVSDFIPVFSGKTYFISGKKTGYGCKLYDIDKHFIKNIQLTHGRLSVEDGINYVRINGEMKDLKNIQVELGTTATSYEPYYKEQTATITMDEPLGASENIKIKLQKMGLLEESEALC